MVLETDPIIFQTWIFTALAFYLAMVGGAAVLALIVGYTAVAVIYGPMRGGDITYQTVKASAFDLLEAAPRRIWALARLAIQESIRRRVWVVFVVFAIILAFAGWFLDPNSLDPGRLYLNFVLNATNLLVLVLALFLSVFSLPADIKNRTIYTIVTKPVRRSEIVLGRVLGFSLIGTVMLVVMGFSSYLFVKRSLHHTHEVEVDTLQTTSDASSGKSGRTALMHGHRHDITVDAEGNGSTDIKHGHWHDVVPSQRSKSGYSLSGPEGIFAARVPKYGFLNFTDRWGKPGKGISVGKEWTYRSFIEGGTLASAIWTFEDVTPDQFPDGLPVEMTIRVFRSWKGKINQGILGSLAVRNPKTGRMSQPQIFRAKDVQIDHQDIPLSLQDAANPSGPALDLFKDLVSSDGKVQLVLQCLDSAQYYGMAKADLYLKARDASFELNFVKGHLGIWFQLLLVTGLGVLFSTFLSGPVAMLATIGSIVVGFFAETIADLASGAAVGGGPIESLVRIYLQTNQTSPLEEGIARDAMQFVDKILTGFLQGTAYLLPDFHRFTNIDHVAYGFDVPVDNILMQLTLTLGYLLAVTVVGTFILKTREVAR
jgi:ABC-type transport system involved in multi-copper enzyme maturation permease subunit